MKFINYWSCIKFHLQTSVEVRWRAPERPNGDIIGYRIMFSEVGSNDFENASVPPESLTHTIAGLGMNLLNL